MVTQSIEREKRTVSTSGQVTRFQEAAETIRDNALNAARLRLPARQQEASLAGLLQIPVFLNSFKYGLAQGVTNVIVANDGNVQSIHLFEESTNPDSETEEVLAWI